MIPERLTRLRAEMAKRNIAIYVVPTADFHESEYVGEYFKARKYMTGFTGSAGTAVITMTEAGLWTDARYFLQAGKQLEGSTVTLYKMGEEGVPTVTEYIEKTLKEGEVIGFDGRVINDGLGNRFAEIAKAKNGSLYVEEDLVDLIWEDRPNLPAEPVWILEEKYAGESTKSKLERVRAKMEEKKATIHLLSSLYDIAWLLNVRGNDINYVPVVLSFLALTKDTCIWFVQEKVLTEELRAYLDENKITTRPYESFYDYVGNLSKGEVVLLNKNVVNYRVCHSIPEGVSVVNEVDPTVLMKSIKNEIQVANIRKAHEKDAVAVIKFMYWLKNNIGKIPMTEISASDYLEEMRKEQDGYLELSFDTICGYAAHGAIMHYAATPETDIPLAPEGFLLVDSGGHYYEGTTDITRTFALGPLTDEMKADFTRVCRSNINLAATKFLHGCSGLNLDVVAREPFWEVGLDFKHGTGHGVGYILNVHEGPNGFRYKQTPDRSEGAILEEGMVTTDEPGIYIEGKYGIRTESELVCRNGEKNEFGQFMYFENVTYVPIDLDAIEPSLMSETERKRLNDYHAMVYKTMAPYFEGEILEFLKEYTRAI
ncbi:MAG: aminopeptidase P family protein [Lachnospiraceae bacterium]|nr:aminopeptidase P family protein [Lachnospiraceae bacterium]